MQFIIGLYDAYETEEILKCIHVPVFCISKKTHNQKISMFPHVEWLSSNDRLFSKMEKQHKKNPWGHRKNVLFWRGSTTGGSELLTNPRFLCVNASKKYPEIINAAFSLITDLDQKSTEQAKKSYFVQPMTEPEKQIEYKYLAAIDGHCFSGAFFWQLRSGSLIFKQESDFLEWYYRGLKAYDHYIPYNPFKEEDLIEKIQIYQKRDLEAKKIAENAWKFAEENLTNEDILVYVYHLLKSYADLQKF
jgi:hypothetical protein